MTQVHGGTVTLLDSENNKIEAKVFFYGRSSVHPDKHLLTDFLACKL
jgi:hypothetical protein